MMSIDQLCSYWFTDVDIVGYCAHVGMSWAATISLLQWSPVESILVAVESTMTPTGSHFAM
jgi:hypothetical protein